MTNTRAINAAAGVIHACVQQGKSLPASIAYALDSAGLLNSPEHAAEVAKLRTDLDECQRRYTEDTAELKRTVEYFDGQSKRRKAERDALQSRVAEVALTIERDNPATAFTHDCNIPLTRRLACGHCPHEICQDCDRCPHTCRCASPEGVSPQVKKLRALIAGQREDAYTSPLHHDYKVPHDLPLPGGAS